MEGVAQPLGRAVRVSSAAPVLPEGTIVRPRLLARFRSSARVVLVVAPPGFGKSTVVAQWAATCDEPLAWISVDLFDESPASFWHRTIEAVQSIVPSVDDDAGIALDERPESSLFLNILIAQLERSASRAVLLLDGLPNHVDRSIVDGLALLAERVGERIQLVITTRVDPPLPFARWRTRGWLAEVREVDLRFTDDEALQVAATFADRGLPDELFVDVNARSEGWPIAFHLALVSAFETDDPERGLRSTASAPSVLSDFVVAEILDNLPADERRVVLDLSVMEWFDADAALELAGKDAGPALVELRRRRLLGAVAGRPNAMRFHPLLRELLVAELRWRDAARHRSLNRRAAELWRRRGAISAAHRHLLEIGDLGGSHELVLGSVLERVDRGDLGALRRMQSEMPDTTAVHDPGLAIDLALAAIFAADRSTAFRWADRAETLVAGVDEAAIIVRLHALHAVLAMLSGRVSDAVRAVASFEERRATTPAGGPIEQRFATVAARLALQRGRPDEARRWLREVRDGAAPSAIEHVTLPALSAWCELLDGRLQVAKDLVEGGCAWSDRARMHPHHGAFDANVVAAAVALAAGDLVAAELRAEAARADAVQLGWMWNTVRATAAAAQVALLSRGPYAALDLLDSTAELDRSVELVEELDLVEAMAWHRAGDHARAASIVGGLVDRPAVRIARASIDIELGRPERVPEMLSACAAWPTESAFRARTLTAVATRRNGDLRTVLEEGRHGGWAGPFLGFGPRVEERVRSQPLASLHPTLSALLDHAPSPKPSPAKLLEQLTARELTVLSLLPTHLSYAEIADRLNVSVNTVKSNLKAVYRKLDVTSRSAAVGKGRAVGLV